MDAKDILNVKLHHHIPLLWLGLRMVLYKLFRGALGILINFYQRYCLSTLTQAVICHDNVVEIPKGVMADGSPANLDSQSRDATVASDIFLPPTFSFCPSVRERLAQAARSNFVRRRISAHRKFMKLLDMKGSIPEEHNALKSSTPKEQRGWKLYSYNSSVARKSWLTEKEERYGKIMEPFCKIQKEERKGFSPNLSPIPVASRSPRYQKYCVANYKAQHKELEAEATKTLECEEIESEDASKELTVAKKGSVSASSTFPIDSRLIPVSTTEPTKESKDDKKEDTNIQKLLSLLKRTPPARKKSRIPVPVVNSTPPSSLDSSPSATSHKIQQHPSKPAKLDKGAPTTVTSSQRVLTAQHESFDPSINPQAQPRNSLYQFTSERDRSFPAPKGNSEAVAKPPAGPYSTTNIPISPIKGDNQTLRTYVPSKTDAAGRHSRQDSARDSGTKPIIHNPPRVFKPEPPSKWIKNEDIRKEVEAKLEKLSKEKATSTPSASSSSNIEDDIWREVEARLAKVSSEAAEEVKPYLLCNRNRALPSSGRKRNSEDDRSKRRSNATCRKETEGTRHSGSSGSTSSHSSPAKSKKFFDPGTSNSERKSSDRSPNNALPGHSEAR